MAELDPNLALVNDPELEANLIRALSIVGRVGKLRVVDIVIPTISLGDVVQPTVEVRTPSFRSSDVFSNGALLAPAGGTILADTGALAAGIFDVEMYFTTNDDTQISNMFRTEHRNAANAANLALWDRIAAFGLAGVGSGHFVQKFAYEVALNERLRVSLTNAAGAGRSWLATIFARLRV